MSIFAVRAPLAWLGPGKLVEDALEINPDAEAIAKALDAERRAGHVRGPLHGIPVLLKDNVDTHDKMQTAAGSIALVGTAPSQDSTVAAKPKPAERGDNRAALLFLAPWFAGLVLISAGPMITCTGGYPTRSSWAPKGTGVEVRGSADAAEAARNLLAGGAAVLKVALNADAGPTLSDEELLAVCEVGHGADVPVTAHCQGRGQVQRAVGAGVDELAHAPWSERLSDDLVRAMAKRMRIVSTLDIHSFGKDTPEVRMALDNLRRFIIEGGAVAYGTDLGNGPIPPGIHGG